MPDFLTSSFADATGSDPLSVAFRLGTAFLLGLLVAQVYRRSRASASASSSFPTTLILLCVLIAMVTQVIGDNVARAFSLVGALSIVRFRTVVRDTEDTAYVIFAVVTGMAVGSRHLWTALIGIVVVAVASLWIRYRGSGTGSAGYLLTLRLPLGLRPEDLPRDGFGDFLQRMELVSLSTSRQGTAMEYIYEIRLKAEGSIDSLIRCLNRQEGVQAVQVRRKDFES